MLPVRAAVAVLEQSRGVKWGAWLLTEVVVSLEKWSVATGSTITFRSAKDLNKWCGL